VGLVTIFYCLRFEISIFVSSYDSQGCDGGIRPRTHSHSRSVRLLLRLFVPWERAYRTVVQQWTLSRLFVVTGTCFSEPFPSNGLFRLSGVMSQYSIQTHNHRIESVILRCTSILYLNYNPQDQTRFWSHKTEDGERRVIWIATIHCHHRETKKKKSFELNSVIVD
jgi:hypothetical protein